MNKRQRLVIDQFLSGAAHALRATKADIISAVPGFHVEVERSTLNGRVLVAFRVTTPGARQSVPLSGPGAVRCLRDAGWAAAAAAHFAQPHRRRPPAAGAPRSGPRSGARLAPARQPSGASRYASDLERVGLSPGSASIITAGKTTYPEVRSSSKLRFGGEFLPAPVQRLDDEIDAADDDPAGLRRERAG